MLMGIRLQAKPTEQQKLVLSQWMGCARFVWNAKCDEDRYLTAYARKYLPVGTHAPVDQRYSQYKDPELSPWLSKCPSQILRNSVSNWMDTYKKFFKGQCGKPRGKKKLSSGSVHLTNELFRFDRLEFGQIRLFVGTKNNNIGFLNLRYHNKNFSEPKSLYIKKKNGDYWVSFCYEDGCSESELFTGQEDLEFLKNCGRSYLDAHIKGVDRGVARPVQFGDRFFDFTIKQKNKKDLKGKYIKRYQKRLLKQRKGSNRREKTKSKIAKAHNKILNIRQDFCHKTSRQMVSEKSTKVIVFEDLKTKNMTKKPKAKPNGEGGWDRNNAKSKAGLNKSILDKGWHKLETFTKINPIVQE